MFNDCVSRFKFIYAFDGLYTTNHKYKPIQEEKKLFLRLRDLWSQEIKNIQFIYVLLLQRSMIG